MIDPLVSQVLVDCANGVGSNALKQLTDALGKVPGGKAAAEGLDMQLLNTGEGQLNDGCGADFVQKDRALPAGIEKALSSNASSGAR